MSSKIGIDFLKACNTLMKNSKGFGQVIKNITIIGGGNGNCVAEFKVLPEYLNNNGGLHGGFTAAAVEHITDCTFLSMEIKDVVSLDLHVSYLKGAQEGDEVTIDARTVRAGRRVAFLEYELKHKKDGSIIATASNTLLIGR